MIIINCPVIIGSGTIIQFTGNFTQAVAAVPANDTITTKITDTLNSITDNVSNSVRDNIDKVISDVMDIMIENAMTKSLSQKY